MNNKNYKFYENLAVDMFSVLRDLICKTNKYVGLQIVPYAYPQVPYRYLYGHMNNTDIITLYLGNIIQKYDSDEITPPDIKKYFNYRRHDIICSNLLYVLVHELHHADQVRYNMDNVVTVQPCYLDMIEYSVDVQSIQFIKDYAGIETGFGFKFIDDSVSYYTMAEIRLNEHPIIYEYERLTLETMFKQVLNTTILRTFYVDDRMDFLEDTKEFPNLYIEITIKDINFHKIFCIRKDGNYVESTLVEILEFLDKYILFHENMIGDYRFKYTETEGLLSITADTTGPFEPMEFFNQ